MSEQDRFDRAVAALHAAMLGDAHWREASTRISDACGMAGVHLVIVDGHCRNQPEWLFDQFYHGGESADELAQEYMKDFFPEDERIPRMMRLPDRRLIHVTGLWTERELKTSATYNDFLRRTRGQVGFNVRMDGPDGMDILMAIGDPVEPGGLNGGHGEMIERLPAPHPPVRARPSRAGGRRSPGRLACPTARQHPRRRDLPGPTRQDHGGQ